MPVVERGVTNDFVIGLVAYRPSEMRCPFDGEVSVMRTVRQVERKHTNWLRPHTVTLAKGNFAVVSVVLNPCFVDC